MIQSGIHGDADTDGRVSGCLDHGLCLLALVWDGGADKTDHAVVPGHCAAMDPNVLISTLCLTVHCLPDIFQDRG